MFIFTYKTSGGKDVIFHFINELPEPEKFEANSIMHQLEDYGLKQLDSKHFIGKVWEIRFYRNNRFFYVLPDNRCIYILHACKKQKNQTENFVKQLVLKRASELGRRIGKNFI
jgi:phage-related protein